MRDFKFTEQERPTMANFNQRFQSIADLANGLGNEYVWEKCESVIVTTDKSSNDTVEYTSTPGIWAYSDSVELVDGVIVLTNPQYGSSNTNITDFSSIITEKYVSISGATPIYITSAQKNTGGFPSKISYKGLVVATVEAVLGYVNSPDPSAYPPSVSDGYTYTALGQFGAKVQIATGSYVGTGTYGESNPNSLTFDFAPKFVVIKNKNAKFGYYGQLGVYLDGGTTLMDISGNSESGCNASVSGNTLSWYSTKYNSQQFNDSTHDGGYYSYIAIG